MKPQLMSLVLFIAVFANCSRRFPPKSEIAGARSFFVEHKHALSELVTTFEAQKAFDDLVLENCPRCISARDRKTGVVIGMSDQQKLRYHRLLLAAGVPILFRSTGRNKGCSVLPLGALRESGDDAHVELLPPCKNHVGSTDCSEIGQPPPESGTCSVPLGDGWHLQFRWVDRDTE
jgi:hypothetical protein